MKIIYAFLLIITFSCQSNVIQNSNDNNKTESFREFLEHFISDSEFRKDRIRFPIDGVITNDYGEVEEYKWNEIDWNFFSEEDINYKKNSNIISEVINEEGYVIWRLYKENSGYDIQYRFKLIKNKWHLVYYSYVNT